MARNHQVPQFYLRNFQIPANPGLFYSYKRNLRPKPLPIAKVAQGEDYYDLKTPTIPLPVDNVDKIFKMSEDAAAPIIRSLITASRFDLAPEDFGELIWFVALQAFRTPLARESMANLNIAFTEREFKKFATDKEAFATLKRTGGDQDSELREKARLALLNDELRLNLKRGGQTEDYLMGLQLGIVNKPAPILGRKFWHILETTNARPFITSDHPTVLLPSPQYRPGMAVGYADGWLMLPLSPKRALLLTNKRYSKDVMAIKKEEKMREYKWYVITQCYQSVFSHHLEGEYQTILDSTVEGETIRVDLSEE
jgi:hypothetical protein